MGPPATPVRARPAHTPRAPEGSVLPGPEVCPDGVRPGGMTCGIGSPGVRQNHDVARRAGAGRPGPRGRPRADGAVIPFPSPDARRSDAVFRPILARRADHPAGIEPVRRIVMLRPAACAGPRRPRRRHSHDGVTAAVDCRPVGLACDRARRADGHRSGDRRTPETEPVSAAGRQVGGCTPKKSANTRPASGGCQTPYGASVRLATGRRGELVENV